MVTTTQEYPTKQENKYDSSLGKVVKSKPFNYAPVTIIEGEQKSGKTETAVTRVVDPTYAGMTSVKLPSKVEVKAEPVLNKNGYPIIGYGKLWLPNEKSPRIMKIPNGSIVIADGVKVIYNGHLYGIRYIHMKLPDIIKHLNDGTIRNCYVPAICSWT